MSNRGPLHSDLRDQRCVAELNTPIAQRASSPSAASTMHWLHTGRGTALAQRNGPAPQAPSARSTVPWPSVGALEHWRCMIPTQHRRGALPVELSADFQNCEGAAQEQAENESMRTERGVPLPFVFLLALLARLSAVSGGDRPRVSHSPLQKNPPQRQQQQQQGTHTRTREEDQHPTRTREIGWMEFAVQLPRPSLAPADDWPAICLLLCLKADSPKARRGSAAKAGEKGDTGCCLLFLCCRPSSFSLRPCTLGSQRMDGPKSARSRLSV